MGKHIVWALGGIAILSACSTAPQKPQTRQGAAAPIVDLRTGGNYVPPAAPAATAPTSGGYLAGDGPGADAPMNLDAIPDAVPKAEPLHRYANREYSALGKKYVPLTAPGNYK